MITVVGSLNMDLLAGVERFPQPGETVLATAFTKAAGAKGGNQAVAAARAGSRVSFIGRVGDDAAGQELVASLEQSGIDTGYVSVDASVPTGTALICVDARGENSIVVVAGANARVVPEDVDTAVDVIAASRFVVLQLEIPRETVEHTARIARSHDTRVLLNPSPPEPCTRSLLQYVNILVLNQHEVASLAGTGSSLDPLRSARALLDRGPHAVVVTLGREGSVVVTREAVARVQAFPVQPVDSTGAGDAYLGNLVHALEAGESLEQAARFASAAAAWSVRVPGAQPAMPTRAQTLSILRGAP